MAAELQPLIDKVWRHCESTGNRGRTFTLKIKFADFETISRSQSLCDPVDSRPELERVAIGLLERLMPTPKAVRLSVYRFLPCKPTWCRLPRRCRCFEPAAT
jgi:DNA polymerase IV